MLYRNLQDCVFRTNWQFVLHGYPNRVVSLGTAICKIVICNLYIKRKNLKMNQYSYKPYYRRNLPHIQPPGATFFITFNLTGSIPKHIYQQYIEEKRKLEAVEQLTFKQKRDIREKKREWFRKFEVTLDQANNGPVWLKNEQIAKLVAESLHYRDGKVFRLDAYCIMANHVHAVFTPLMKQLSDTVEDTQTNRLCYEDEDTQTNSLCYRKPTN